MGSGVVDPDRRWKRRAPCPTPIGHRGRGSGLAGLGEPVLVARRGALIGRPDDDARLFQRLQPRRDSVAGCAGAPHDVGEVGCPSAISRTISSAQRSPTSSSAAAIGQGRPGSSANGSDGAADMRTASHSEFENQTYGSDVVDAVLRTRHARADALSTTSTTTSRSAGFGAGGVAGRDARGDHRRRTQRQAHRIRQRRVGSRSGGPAAGAAADPRRQGRVVTGVHRRRRRAVRREPAERGRRQAARVAVAAARRRRRGVRGAGVARRSRGGAHRVRRSTSPWCAGR